MTGLGAAFFGLGLFDGDQGYLWTGIGVAIGGGCTAARAFLRHSDESERPRLVGPRAELMLMAFMFVIVGVPLIVVGSITNRQELVWSGFGLVMAGGVCWHGTWQTEETATAADPETASQSPPVKPDMPTADDLRLKNSRLKIPAIGLCVAGAIDCCLLLAIVGIMGFMAAQAAGGFGVLGAQELLIIGSGSVFGIGRLVGGISMLSRRSYALSIFGAICALVPCSPTWLLGLPFGIWSLMVLNTPEARREFEVAAEWREQEAFEREGY